MTCLGIDPGLQATGLVELSGDGSLVQSGAWTSSKSDEVGDTRRRLDDLLSWLTKTIVETRLTVIVVEFPSANTTKGRGYTDPRAYLAAGTIFGFVRALKVPVLSPVPTTWRAALSKSFGLPFEHGKEHHIHAKLDQIYGITKKHGKTKGRHVLDAAGTAVFGLHQFAGQLALEGGVGPL